jgi:hypothetical protein
MLPQKTMDHPTLDMMVHYLVAHILSWLLSSNGLQHLVNHKSPNYISYDIFNRLHNLFEPVHKSLEQNNQFYHKNALSIFESRPNTNTQKHQLRDVVLVLSSPLWIILIGQQIILFILLV